MSTKPQEERQGKHYKVDVENIRPLERTGGNIRKDLGDLSELAASIEQNGILNPIRAMRDLEKEGKWIAIDGHRRLAAAMLLVKKGQKVFVQVIVADARFISDEDILFEMITSNQGKPLTFTEQAEAVRRLIVLGVDKKKIAEKFAKPVPYINNLILLSKASTKIKTLIDDNRIAPHLVLHVLKTSKDFPTATETIEAMFKGKKLVVKSDENATAETSTTITPAGQPAAAAATSQAAPATTEKPEKDRVTRADLAHVRDETDSYKELKKAMRNAEKEGWVKNPDTSEELHKFVKKIAEGKYTQEKLEKLLFLK